jgi:hypothetical protein
VDSAHYVQRVLDVYRATPGACGVVRKPDRVFALALFARGVPIEAVENALALAAARRMARPAGATPLGVIRSLAYFGPVIDEVLAMRVGQDYFQHLRHRLARLSR